MFTHTLSKPADNWFLEKKMHDPLVYSDFKEGDEIVVCQGCKQVFLAICWDDFGDGCPFCHATSTTPFSRSAFHHRGSSTIEIKSTSARQSTSSRSTARRAPSSSTVRRTPSSSTAQRRRGNSVAQTPYVWIETFARLFCARVKPVMSVLLWGAVAASIVLQGKAVLLDNVSLQQFPDAFARTRWAVVSLIEETTQSAEDALEETAQSVTDTFDEISWTTDRMVQSVSDGIQRAQASVNRPLDDYLPG